MTYSIHARGVTKAEAKQDVATKFDDATAHQPAHATDKAAALAVAGAYIDLVRDDPTKDVVVALSGWLSVGADGYSAANVFCTVELVTKKSA